MKPVAANLSIRECSELCHTGFYLKNVYPKITFFLQNTTIRQILAKKTPQYTSKNIIFVCLNIHDHTA